jgi:hypothetical protein
MKPVLLAIACVLVLAFVGSATADIGIRTVDRATAKPGDTVRVTARGFLGDRPWPAMPVVMLAAPRPDPSIHLTHRRMRPARLRRPPYRFLGTITRWRRLPNGHGVGHLRFRVPRVARGRYVFGLFCDDCVRGTKGSLIIDHRLVLRVKRARPRRSGASRAAVAR